MHLNSRLALTGTAVDEYIVKVRLRKRAQRTEQLGDQSVERRGCIRQPLWHYQPLPQHPARGAYCCEWDVAFAHQDLVISIYQIQCAVKLTSWHVV